MSKTIISKIEIHKTVIVAIRQVGKIPENVVLSDEIHLFKSEILSSLGFMDLIVSIEIKLNIQIDFSDLDPNSFLTIGGFKNLVEKSML